MKVSNPKYSPILNFLHYQVYNRIVSRWFKIPSIWFLKLEYLLSRKKSKHNLPFKLVVSLTSIPTRFKTVEKTIKCLINQSVTPDCILLWISNEDKYLIPKNLLQVKGLTVKYCDNYRSYKKLLPTISLFPDAFIVTADDDLFYDYNWLKRLTENYSGNLNEVICNIAKLIKLDKNNDLLPYKLWETASKPIVSNLLVPRTGTGALFPPNIFQSFPFDYGLIKELCPTADDLWIWCLVNLNKGKFKKIGGKYKTLNTSNYDQVGLWYENTIRGGNDKQMKNLLNHFGWENLFLS